MQGQPAAPGEARVAASSAAQALLWHSLAELPTAPGTPGRSCASLLPQMLPGCCGRETLGVLWEQDIWEAPLQPQSAVGGQLHLLPPVCGVQGQGRNKAF